MNPDTQTDITTGSILAAGHICLDLIPEPNALSGISSSPLLTERIRGGWAKRESTGEANGWQWNNGLSMWQGPNG